MSELFLGIDGGQSSTTALLGDSTGRVIGMGRGGPCNHVGAAQGREKLTSAVTACVTAACLEAGLRFGGLRFRACCMGFSGGPDDKRDILAEILPADALAVVTDAVIALAGAHGGEPGIITIAGTGSIAFGRNREGRTARAGGWGYIFGDEGGGFDLVRRALRAALRFEEGWGPPTSLKARLLQTTEASSANEVLHRFYTSDYPRARIASMSRLVDDAARDGDPVAREILTGAAQDLALLAGAVRRQLFEEETPVRIATIGGVFHSEILRERFQQLLELDESVAVGPPLLFPAAGALIEAYRLAGRPVGLSRVPVIVK